MARTRRAYPCAGTIISSPNTRTWFVSFSNECCVIGPRTVEPSAIQTITILITGNVTAVPCEANFLNDRKLLSSEMSSLRYLVRAACRAYRIEGFLLNIRSTVQHVRRSDASDKSTVANDRSWEAFRTKSPDFDCLLKSRKA